MSKIQNYPFKSAMAGRTFLDDDGLSREYLQVLIFWLYDVTLAGPPPFPIVFFCKTFCALLMLRDDFTANMNSNLDDRISLVWCV